MQGRYGALHDDFNHQFTKIKLSYHSKNRFEIFLRAYWEENIPLKFSL